MEVGASLAPSRDLNDLSIFDGQETQGTILQKKGRLAAEDRIVFRCFLLIEQNKPLPIALGDECKRVAGGRGMN